MIAMNIQSKTWWGRHWFLPVAIVVAMGDMGSVWLGDWRDGGRLLEAALLLDFVVLLPLLYAWCYRSRGKAAVVQAVALACFAIWAMGKTVPVEHQHLLESVAWLRYAGLAGLALLEIKLGVAIYKTVVLSGQPKAQVQQAFESEGVPPWLARFMAWEASLWRRAWRFIQRCCGRR